MNKEQLAGQLDGRQYGSEVSQDMELAAKMSGLVIVFGASDDLMEFRGAIHDEFSGIAFLTGEGVLTETCDCECKYFKAVLENTVTVKAIWGKGEYSFQYETKIPHATFEIFDGEEKYCRGIVFSMDDLKTLVESVSGVTASKRGE